MVRVLLLSALSLVAVPAAAQSLGAPGKLLLTNGITTIEGSAGGGLTPWAVIAGNETRDGIGAQAGATAVELADYGVRGVGVAIGVRDRVELSYARQALDTRAVGATLGIGRGYVLDQDVWGAKVKLAGDAVYGPRWLPAVAVGAQYKKSLDPAVVGAVGGRDRDGVDYYVSATRLFLDWSLLANVTLRATRGNQGGLLGHGGDANDGYRVEAEGSLAYQLSRRLAIGAEYRRKPDNLGFAREDDWWDAFAALAIGRHLTATVAYADLGAIATVKGQRGVLVQLQGSF